LSPLIEGLFFFFERLPSHSLRSGPHEGICTLFSPTGETTTFFPPLPICVESTELPVYFPSACFVSPFRIFPMRNDGPPLYPFPPQPRRAITLLPALHERDKTCDGSEVGLFCLFVLELFPCFEVCLPFPPPFYIASL